MSYIIKICSPPNFTDPVWVLRYAPNSLTPFTTLQGTEHVWVWDFISGEFLIDGAPLLGYTIEISTEGG